MGRRRTINKHLPRRMLLKHGALIAALVGLCSECAASEPVGCYLPDHCGIPGMTCEIQCAALSEFDWFRYCDGHLSDGYVWHPVFGGQYAARLRVEQNLDMTFVTHNDNLTWDDAESPLCGDWGLHIRP